MNNCGNNAGAAAAAVPLWRLRWGDGPELPLAPGAAPASPAPGPAALGVAAPQPGFALRSRRLLKIRSCQFSFKSRPANGTGARQAGTGSAGGPVALSPPRPILAQGRSPQSPRAAYLHLSLRVPIRGRGERRERLRTTAP